MAENEWCSTAVHCKWPYLEVLVAGLLMACFVWLPVERKIPQGNHVGFPRLEWSTRRSNWAPTGTMGQGLVVSCDTTNATSSSWARRPISVLISSWSSVSIVQGGKQFVWILSETNPGPKGVRYVFMQSWDLLISKVSTFQGNIVCVCVYEIGNCSKNKQNFRGLRSGWWVIFSIEETDNQQRSLVMKFELSRECGLISNI